MKPIKLKKCKHWKEYKAERPPKCGCDFCHDLWRAKIDFLGLHDYFTAKDYDSREYS